MSDTPFQFRDAEHAHTILGMLADMIKYGTAKPCHIERYNEAKAYLGLDKKPEEMAAKDIECLDRAQGCIDACMRNIVNPLKYEGTSTPSGQKIHRALTQQRLSEAMIAVEVARDILKEAPGTRCSEIEERVKGLLLPLYNRPLKIIYTINKPFQE